MRRTAVFLIVLCFIASHVLFSLAANAQEIEFHTSVENAREVDSEKPLVMYFGAPWCSACRMMHDNTFTSQELEPITDKYLWVEIDIDDDPLAAARYSVAAVPTLVVLDAQDTPIGKHAGFLPPERLIQFIEDSIANPILLPTSVAELVNDLSSDELSDEEQFFVVQQVIESLADPERQDRVAILDALVDHKETLVPNLIVLMENDQLALRAAAGQALASISETPVRFDPFESADVRKNQVQKIAADFR